MRLNTIVYINGEDYKVTLKINKLKAKLIAKAKKSGIYENFGQKEVLHLQDIFYTNYQANSKVRDLIDKFDSWCMNFDDRDLRG